ncbi:S8 family serine peptidase [Marinobacter sp. X15-166B]|uniref:S8 family serine peptidase n=1 Tax=Marinobacter sp. X15-166B TaxID=1897620 RepID=UPI001300D015|nr:S8 family serine peptidase [Marinobacter sp. X15-166B]
MMWRRSLCVFLLPWLLAACGGGSETPRSGPDISGTIIIESHTRVDGDTADDTRLSRARSNDSPGEAQPLPPTGVVGGFLSATAGGHPSAAGASLAYPRDAVDYYRVRLAAGDQVVLHVFPSADAPGNLPPVVDIRIIGADGVDVCGAHCTGTPPLMHVVDGAAGSFGFYHLAVHARAGGPFRYVVRVSSPGVANAGSAGYVLPQLVVDEAIVIMQPDPGRAPRSAAAAGGRHGILHAMGAGQARPLGQAMWQLRRQPPVRARGLGSAPARSPQADTLAWIEGLNQRPEVQWAEPNYLFRSQQITAEDEDLYQRQWHLPLISLPLAWQAAPQGGQGVGVAVMDTGLFNIDATRYGDWHPDLAANVPARSGAILDYVSAGLDLDHEPGRDQNPADPGDGKPQSSSFHGTHVAGIVAAADNGFGVIGVAPRATLFPLRVLGQGGVGSAADLIAALQWAATQHAIDVINLSLGGLGPSEALRQAIDLAYHNGKLVVAAAGNEGSDEPTYPAAFANVVGVGAVDAGRVRAGYSNTGASVDLVAPGGDASRDANLDGDADLIASSWGDDRGGVRQPGYAALHGTSMAAPQVTGVYALMKAAARSAGTELGPSEFFALLHSGALTDALANPREYGQGLINGLKAIDAALAGTIPTVVGVSPAAVQLSGQHPVQTVTLMVYPEGETATLVSLDPLPPWLSIAPALVPGDALPDTLTVTARGEQLRVNPGQLFRASIRLHYTAGAGQAAPQRSLEFAVHAQYGDPPDQRNAGWHYVILTPAEGGQHAVAQAEVAAEQGEYRFSFAGVAPGRYFVVAGTDMDNNGIICENGEACAEYPVNGFPEPVSIAAGSTARIRMTTSFRRPAVAPLAPPRYGFTGYRLLSSGSPAVKSVRR